MSQDDRMPPLDPALRELLEEEAARPNPTLAVQAEVKRALLAGLGAAAAAPVLTSAATSAGAATSAIATTGVVAGAGLSSVKLVPLAIAFLLGAGGGVGLYVAVAPERAPQVKVVIKEVRVPEPARPMPAPIQPVIAPVQEAPRPVVEPTPSDTPQPPKHVLAKLPPSAASTDPKPGRDADLAEETALISRAQTALSRGAYARALEALRLHAAQYARGQMVEEREALWVQALVGEGQREAAVARAKSFARQFPGSPLREVVDHALEQSP